MRCIGHYVPWDAPWGGPPAWLHHGSKGAAPGALLDLQPMLPQRLYQRFEPAAIPAAATKRGQQQATVSKADRRGDTDAVGQRLGAEGPCPCSHRISSSATADTGWESLAMGWWSCCCVCPANPAHTWASCMLSCTVWLVRSNVLLGGQPPCCEGLPDASRTPITQLPCCWWSGACTRCWPRGQWAHSCSSLCNSSSHEPHTCPPAVAPVKGHLLKLQLLGLGCQ